MDNSFNALAPENKVADMLKNHTLFDCTCFTSYELIRETLPMFDEVTILCMYKYLNAKFLDEDDLNEIDRKIIKLKKIEQSIIDHNLKLFEDASANKLEDISLIE